jgi:adenylate cyclase
VAEKNKRLKNIVIFTAISFALSLALYIPSLLFPFENKIFDLFSRHLNPPRASDTIIIVEVDQQSIDALSKEGVNWPWPRQIYVPILDYLSQAKAVFIDILFTEPSFYGQEDDLSFAKAIKDAANVYLPFFLSRNPKEVSPQDMAFVSRSAVNGASPSPARLTYQSVTTPIEVLREHVKGSGNVAVNPDGGDVYRSIPLLFILKDVTVPNLTFSYFTGQGIAKVNGERVRIDDTEVPLTNGRVTLRYFRGKDPFQTISAGEIIAAYNGKVNPSRPITREYFKGKTVFIGLTAAGLLDLKPTPISSVSTGVHVNATMFDNLSNKTFMKPVSSIAAILLMFAIALVIVSFVLTHHSILRNLGVFVAIFCLVLGLCAFLFAKTYYLPSIYPMVTLVISFIVSASFSLASEGRQRRFIRRTFSQYVDRTIVDYVLQNPDIIKPGGKKSWVTVLFADIAGFTTISEKNTPEDTAKMLHTALDSLTEVVIDEQGVVDKYIGDCIMAFWGAPLHTKHDEINACRAALRFITSIEEVNGIFRSQGVEPIAIRVGLHTGDAIAGNMGSVRLFDYTVIGDTVNLASRLESVNKVFNTKVIISEKTLEKTEELFFTRDLGPIEVKGKSEPARIYELVSEIGSVDPSARRKVGLFHEALTLYRAERFEDAIRQLDALLEEYPGDGPSLFYRKRCEALASSFPLTKKWDIIKMTEK